MATWNSSSNLLLSSLCFLIKFQLQSTLLAVQKGIRGLQDILVRRLISSYRDWTQYKEKQEPKVETTNAKSIHCLL